MNQKENHYELISRDPEENSNVVNLSGIPISETKTSLLSRGLTFRPTLHHLNITEIMNDLESFFRRLHQREHFIDEEEEEDDTNTSFRSPNTWMPPKGRDAALKTYIRKVRMDVEYQIDNRQVKIPKNNLPSEERLTLKNL